VTRSGAEYADEEQEALGMKIGHYVHNSLILALGAAQEAVWRDVNDRLRSEGCNLMQALLLIAIFLEQGEPVTPSALAATLRTTRGNVSHGVTHLEKRKLLRRTLSAADARSYHLTLTAEGQRAAIRLIAVIDGHERRFEDVFGRADVDALIARLGAIAEAARVT
jgi:DNA-binding MarR family transcriptional regulator